MSNRIRIGIGIGVVDDPFWAQVHETIFQRGFKLPVELIPIHQSGYFPSSAVDENNAILDEVLSHELDVLLGWSFPDFLANLVLGLGVPIVHLYESRVTHPLAVSPIGLQEIAEELAHYLAKLLNKKGNVLVIGGMLRDEHPDDGRSRIAGIQAAFRRYPEVKFHHLRTDWLNNADAEIRSHLATWPYPIDAIFGLSDSLALLGRQIALETGRCEENVPVVGINGDPMAIAAVIEGRMTATVETPAISLANQAFDIALKIASGQPHPAHYEFNPRLITADNVASIATQKLVAIANTSNYFFNFVRSQQQEYHHYLETNLAISRQIGSILELDQLPLELAGLVRANYGFDHAHLYLWSEKEQQLTLAGESHPNQKIELFNSGPLGEVLLRNKAIYIPDHQRSVRFAPDLDWPNTHSRVILPIRRNDAVLGLLDLHAIHVVRCTQQQLEALQSLADQIGIAIHNASLYRAALRGRAVAEKASLSKTRLLASVSHELRNPLNTILDDSENLLVPPESAAKLQSIQQSAQRMLKLTNDLLDLSREEVGELPTGLEMTEPAALLEERLSADGPGLILIIDDDLEMAEFYRNLVMEAFPGYACQTVSNAIAAIEIMTTEVPHLVILDLIMPERDGFEVVRWMRTHERTSQVPVTILSGKRLTLDDIKTLEPYPRITLQSKLVVSDSELIASLRRALFDNDALPPQTGMVVRQVMVYIQQNFANPLSRTDIARAVGVSERYLTQIFHREVGISLWDYLNRYRVYRAKELLRTTIDSIAHISFQVGFDDPAYFARIFRRYVGQSPRDYRDTPVSN